MSTPPRAPDAAKVVGFVDVVESAATRVRGRGDDITRTLELAEAALCSGPIRRIGPVQGDGFLFAGPAALAAAALRDALRYQEEANAPLTVRITFCVGVARELADGNLAGTVVDRSARLKDVCPVGGVALDVGMFAFISDHPRLRERLVMRVAKLKGLGEETFWIAGGDMTPVPHVSRRESDPVDADYSHKRTNGHSGGLALSTPGGWKARVWGRDWVVVMIAAAMLLLSAWDTREQHKALGVTFRQLQDRQSWILTLTASERTALRGYLDVPEGLERAAVDLGLVQYGARPRPPGSK